MFKKRNYTKWIPLGIFTFDGSQFIVFVRGDKLSGEMFFETKKVNNRKGTYNSCVSPIMTHDTIDVKKQWEEITKTISEH